MMLCNLSVVVVYVIFVMVFCRSAPAEVIGRAHFLKLDIVLTKYRIRPTDNQYLAVYFVTMIL